jgi:hypothetical protein
LRLSRYLQEAHSFWLSQPLQALWLDCQLQKAHLFQLRR